MPEIKKLDDGSNIKIKDDTDKDNKLPSQAWSSQVSEILDRLDSSAEKGLSQKEAEERLEEFGPNELKKISERSPWSILLDQVKSIIIYILTAAAAVAFIRRSWVDGGAILAVIVINILIGFFTELKATRSIESLQKIDEAEALVIRDGDKHRIPARKAVPGDIILLKRGEMIPADIRLIDISDLQADESALTGESVPVDKNTKPADKDASLADRHSMAFKGTAVTRGEGKGIITATGMRTSLGRISSMVEGEKDQDTPLEKRLDRLGVKLAYATLGIAFLLVLTGIMVGRELTLILETAIALGIAAIPEGLPIVATVALARGMWRMLKRNALIRNLASVETLGSTNLICTDKTGTLTTGQMTVKEMWLVTRKFVLEEEKSGKVKFTSGDSTIGPEDDEVLKKAMQVSILCNDHRPDEGKNNNAADPIELALLDMGDKSGIEYSSLKEQMPEVDRKPFDSKSKKMATIHRLDKGYFAAVKGAPETVIEKCTQQYTKKGFRKLKESDRKNWLANNRDMSKKGLRVLALAGKNMDARDEKVYSDLGLLGFVGFLDPCREDVPGAVRDCHDAGIRVIMVTGDHPETARHIGLEIGIIESDDDNVINGTDFDELYDDPGEGQKQIRDTNIFARVSPGQKLDLVKLHRKDNSIVAMTGDGINDAPALKAADIGISMGKRGTQVAKETADMVLQDDSFPTIIAAVRQGRIIFENIRKFVIYLLSGNVGEILAVGFATIISSPLPLLPLQILYLNILNDVFPALALGLSGGDRTIMDQPPRDSREPIITGYHWGEITGYGLLIGINLLSVFYLAIHWLGVDNTEAVTMSFLTISISRLFHTFNMRNPKTGILKNEITRNIYVWGAIVLSGGLLIMAVYWPLLADILDVSPPGIRGWILVLSASLIPLFIGQIYIKFFKNKRKAF
jgi:P-type Ca2+ transporter type 2C